MPRFRTFHIDRTKIRDVVIIISLITSLLSVLLRHHVALRYVCICGSSDSLKFYLSAVINIARYFLPPIVCIFFTLEWFSDPSLSTRRQSLRHNDDCRSDSFFFDHYVDQSLRTDHTSYSTPIHRSARHKEVHTSLIVFDYFKASNFDATRTKFINTIPTR